MGYSKDVIKGVSWIGLFRIVTRILSFVRVAILARILSPVDFGIFGIASLLLAFLEIITETGINIFLVQQKKNISTYLNAAWIVSILRGTILAIALVLFSSIIAQFFNAPSAQHIIVMMALVPFIRGFINPAIITFQKELQFQKEFWFRFVLFAIDATVAILVAFITKDAISFVYGLIISALLEVILSFYLIHDWPRFQFELVKVKMILSKGWWVTLTGVFQYIAEQGDDIVVGRFLNTGALGIYQVAYKFSTLPITEITNVVNKVLFPVYVNFSDDRQRLLKALVRITGITTVGALLIAVVLFFFAQEIIQLLLGEQWLAAVPVIKVLAVYGFLRTIFGNIAPVFLAIGKQDYIAKMTFFRVLGLLITVVPFVMLYGLVGAGLAAIFSILFEIPVALYFTFKVFRR